MDAAPAVLGVAGLKVRYGSREVLRGVELSLSKGDIFGLLGPNGAGKTTLIRTICGRIRPWSGSVWIMGQPVSRLSLRCVGLVPQEIALYPHLTVRENLEVFGRLSGLRAADTKAAIAWAGQAVDIEHRLSDRIDILSGGWRRRVNIAAAILHRPDLLILDEPTVGVDVDARNGLHAVIQQLSREGMGILLATHDLDQAELLCGRVGFLRHGVIAPQGNPRALVESVFRGQREIIIELRQHPTAQEAQALQTIGFVRSNGDLNWSTMTSGDDASARKLVAAAERAGLVTREVSFREPGLDRLFVHLSRDPAAPPAESAA